MAFITIAGENKIAYQQGNSLLLNITHFVLANIAGLGAEPANRIEGLPSSGDIVHTQAVTRKGYVNANQVVYSLAMDSTIGDFDFNWVGIKDADNVLIACSHIPTQQKRATAGAVPGNNVTRNFLLAYSGIAATTAIAVPAETWQIDFTTRLLQIDERERLSNFDIYGQAAFFGDGFKVSLQSGSTYQMAAGIGYVGGIRCEQLTAATLNVTGLPKSIWMDASLQGDINGVSAVFSFSATAATLTNYTDGSGFKHYVTKIADISAGGVITDTRLVVGDNTGAIVMFPRTSAPPGYIKANGALLSRTVYAKLFSVYGTTFGAGDGSTTFGTPDFRGVFPRFLDDGRGIDPGRVLGSVQLDDIKNHNHVNGAFDRLLMMNGLDTSDGSAIDNANLGGEEPNLLISAPILPAGGSETRPINVALLACIKV